MLYDRFWKNILGWWRNIEKTDDIVPMENTLTETISSEKALTEEVTAEPPVPSENASSTENEKLPNDQTAATEDPQLTKEADPPIP